MVWSAVAMVSSCCLTIQRLLYGRAWITRLLPHRHVSRRQRTGKPMSTMTLRLIAPWHKAVHRWCFPPQLRGTIRRQIQVQSIIDLSEIWVPTENQSQNPKAPDDSGLDSSLRPNVKWHPSLDEDGCLLSKLKVEDGIVTIHFNDKVDLSSFVVISMHFSHQTEGRHCKLTVPVSARNIRVATVILVVPAPARCRAAWSCTD